MSSETRQCFRAGLIIRPPYVIAPDLGIAALDVAIGPVTNTSDSDIPLLCLGGHPARECVLDAIKEGPRHEAIVAIDPSQPRSLDFVKRLRSYLDPSIWLRVVARDQQVNEVHL